jgi:hypothetical protein
MKRYRVWEANRKIFLYPENWLEPELRDDKSPFFRDLEGELLQADITDELAETALLNYLEKLDDVSKLEISGMYLQENEAGNESDDILHVFGRTTGTSRKYYYRRFEYGYWTPWEKVDLDIEDNPILPVVWKNRLFLFWLNIVRKGPDGNVLPEPEDGEGTLLTGLTTADINPDMIVKIEINLSWSEYFNNKWQPRKTSDFDSPIVLGDFKPVEPDKFKREKIKISSSFVDSGLKVFIDYPDKKPLYSDYPIKKSHFFKLFNKHSVPISYPTIAIEPRIMGYFDNYEKKLDIIYKKEKFTSDTGIQPMIQPFIVKNHEILKKTRPYNIVKTNHSVTNIFEAPFFYQDSEHVFFVKPEERLTPVSDPQNVAVLGGVIPDLRIEEEPFKPIWERPDIFVDLGITELLNIPVGIRPDDPRTSTIDFLDETVSVNRVVLDNRTVTFGDEIIGLMGSQHAHLLYNNKIGEANFEMINIKRVPK